jgi:hypothetical protein
VLAIGAGDGGAEVNADVHRLRGGEGTLNVVLIMLDDMGFGQAGSFGGPTPNMDKLAGRFFPVDNWPRQLRGRSLSSQQEGKLSSQTFPDALLLR